MLISGEDYPGAHVRLAENGPLHAVVGFINVCFKGNIILGWNINGHIRPIYNSEGKATLRNTATQTNELFTLERAEELGLLPYLSDKAREHLSERRRGSSSPSIQLN